MSRSVLALCLFVSALSAAAAQTHQPYAGLQERPIKALSAEQIADLRAGRGMGFALAAELNGYPGPTHVRELADELRLTEAQRAQTDELLDDMRGEVVPLGERLIEEEAALDALFSTRSATPENIAAATQAIGATEAALRAAHLKYHLSAAELLTPEQMRRYAELRGYAGTRAGSHGQGGGAHGRH